MTEQTKANEESQTANKSDGATSTDATAMQDRLAYLESEAKKAFAARDAAKEKLRGFEGKAKELEAQEARRMAEAGQYKDLADQYKARVDELEPLTGEIEQLKSFVSSQVKAAKSELPDELRGVIPETMPAVEQLKLIEGLQKTLRKQAPPSMPPAHAPSSGPGGDVVARYMSMSHDPLARQAFVNGLSADDRGKLIKYASQHGR